MHSGSNSVNFILSVTSFVYTVLLAYIFSLKLGPVLATLLELQFLMAILAVSYSFPYTI